MQALVTRRNGSALMGAAHWGPALNKSNGNWVPLERPVWGGCGAGSAEEQGRKPSFKKEERFPRPDTSRLTSRTESQALLERGL